MRILYLSPCAQLGGAERCLLDVLASLRRSNPDCALHLIAAEDGPLLPEARSLGAHVRILPFPAQLARLGASGNGSLRLLIQSCFALPGLIFYRNRLRREILRIAPDVVHTNGFKMHFLGAWSSVAPVVWHLHDYLSSRPAFARALRWSARRVRAVIAVSRDVAADARAPLGDRVSIETIPNAVDLSRFHPRGSALNLDAVSRFSAPAGTVRVGLIAAFARWKGQETFLRALASPELQGCKIHGYVVGGPIYRTANSQHNLDELRLFARSLGLEERVSFTGFLPDTPAAMRALDIVVHASTQPEPFGLVIAEAMACGRPVIVSDSGGAAELFRHGQDAWGVPPSDHRALALAIQQLASDPVLRFRIATAARITAEFRFNRNRLGPALYGIYRSILQGKVCASSTSTAEISTAA